MKITVLGSGSAVSNPGRFNSCYMVEVKGSCLLIDCGSDALRALQAQRVDLSSVNEIVITHMHADHCAGLPAVLTAMHVLGRKEPIVIRIPYTQLEFVNLWLANLFIYKGRMSFDFNLIPIRTGKVPVGSESELEFNQTRHLEKYAQYAGSFGISPLSFSIIVREKNRTFFFSSDINSTDEVKSFVEMNSVSLIEATHPPMVEIAEMAKSAAGNIFFTHIPRELEPEGEWTEELRVQHGVFNLNMVHDGQIFEV